MPMHFDRFRLLNDGHFRNESSKVVYVRAYEDDPPIEVQPGIEVELPQTSAGETLIEVLSSEPD